jgi:hypothetical protein
MAAEDGTFRIGPTEAGSHTLGLMLDPSLWTRGRPIGRPFHVLTVLELSLPVGETQRDIDLRQGFPGVIALTLEIQQTPAADDARAEITNQQLRVYAVPRFRNRDTVDEVAASSRKGEPFEIGPLPPGDWSVFARIPKFGPWSWPVFDAVSVGPGDRVERRFKLEITTASLDLVDASTGAPLEVDTVEVGQLGPDGLTSTERGLYDKGRIALAMPAGDYMVTARKEGLVTLAGDRDAWAPLTWTESGPLTDVLRVPR